MCRGINLFLNHFYIHPFKLSYVSMFTYACIETRACTHYDAMPCDARVLPSLDHSFLLFQSSISMKILRYTYLTIQVTCVNRPTSVYVTYPGSGYYILTSLKISLSSNLEYSTYENKCGYLACISSSRSQVASSIR